MTTITIERDLLERALKIIQLSHVFSIPDCEAELRAALAAQPSAPAWHDAPNAPGLWWVAGPDRVVHIPENAIAVYKGSSHRWFGPISPDTEDTK